MKIKLDDPIYVITLIAPPQTSLNRKVGYTHTLEYAKDILRDQPHNLHECLYEYIVIEKICEGIFRSVQSEYWYEWDEVEQIWNECGKPAEFRSIVNFGIG